MATFCLVKKKKIRDPWWKRRALANSMYHSDLLFKDWETWVSFLGTRVWELRAATCNSSSEIGLPLWSMSTWPNHVKYLFLFSLFFVDCLSALTPISQIPNFLLITYKTSHWIHIIRFGFADSALGSCRKPVISSTTEVLFGCVTPIQKVDLITASIFEAFLDSVNVF